MIEFFRQLQRRRYAPEKIRPLFDRAVSRLTARLRRPPVVVAAAAAAAAAAAFRPSNDIRRCMLFHLQYHPQNPPSHDIQRLWKSLVAEPPNSMPLVNIRNYCGVRIDVERKIMAYNRPPNLGNLLSYRRLKDNAGPPVSSFASRNL